MRSRAYWAARAAALEYHIQTGAAKPIGEIARLYRTATEQVQQEIEKIRRELMRRGDLTPAEWNRLLRRAEADASYGELTAMLRETDDPATVTSILNRMDAQAYGARITRLESVKNKIFHEFTKAAAAEKSICDLFFGNVLQEAYYTDVYNLAEGYNCAVALDVLPKRAIRQALLEPWQGRNYSERIWQHSQAFIQQVETTITTGLLNGSSVPQMAAQLREFTDKANYVTERLVRTETAHFMALGQKDAYEAAGLNRYRFLAALSERTCEVCGGLDSQVFNVADARDGYNYPPIHPNCRCTTIPADTELGSRRAYDPETGKSYLTGDVSFAEWKEGLTGEQAAVMEKYAGVDKSAGSGIISSEDGKIMSIKTMDSPIEQRNTGKGNPNAIIHSGRPLNNRQQRLLAQLPGYDSSVIVRKKSVNMRDLSAITAETGDEFAMFTKGGERLIIRGNGNSVNVNERRAKELNKQGYKWSGHTHPGVDMMLATPSQGDKEILRCFNQGMSVIYNAAGKFRTFEKE